MIKVGYCVAYDWEMLRNSIPTIYKEADRICLSIDINRQSWTGTPFSWDEEGFRRMVHELDSQGKIEVYEDTFYNPSLLPMQNEVVQRNKIANFLGKGGWHIQLDADEYFINFSGFVQYLKGFNTNQKVNICCPMINLYKQLPEGMLWIKPYSIKNTEFFTIATQYPQYEYGRRNGNFNILTNYSILHQSWARSEREIWEKLNNWGHAKDFDVTDYFNLWKNVDGSNYQNYKDFHHLHPHNWPALALAPKVNSIKELMNLKTYQFELPIKKLDLILVNSIWISRLRKLVNTIFSIRK